MAESLRSLFASCGRRTMGSTPGHSPTTNGNHLALDIESGQVFKTEWMFHPRAEPGVDFRDADWSDLVHAVYGLAVKWKISRAGRRLSGSATDGPFLANAMQKAAHFRYSLNWPHAYEKHGSSFTTFRPGRTPRFQLAIKSPPSIITSFFPAFVRHPIQDWLRRFPIWRYRFWRSRARPCHRRRTESAKQ